MKKKQKESSIKSLIKNFSIETTPSVYTKYGNFTKFLNHKNDVYVTFLPNEKYQRVIDTSKKLNEEGFRAIPHLPARTFENNSHLEKYVGKKLEFSQDADYARTAPPVSGQNVKSIYKKYFQP